MTSQPFSRRTFLSLSAGLGAGAVLAACGGSSSSGLEGDLQVVKRFPDSGLVPGTVRLPISLGDKTGVLGKESNVELPASLTASVQDAQTGKIIIASVTAERHDEGLDIPYWPFVFPIDAQGIFLLKINEAPDSDCSFQIEDPKNVLMPTVGNSLPPFDTPTTSNARGVDPICTRTPDACPFHSVTLTDALKSGKPVVYYIGTPAYCQTGTCAPGLDALIATAKTVGNNAVFVHADVYTDKNANEATAAVQEYKLTYEPVLYITDATGKLVNRLDAVFDARELTSALRTAGIA